MIGDFHGAKICLIHPRIGDFHGANAIHQSLIRCFKASKVHMECIQRMLSFQEMQINFDNFARFVVGQLSAILWGILSLSLYTLIFAHGISLMNDFTTTEIIKLDSVSFLFQVVIDIYSLFTCLKISMTILETRFHGHL
jgi:hypothetical protein